MRAPIPLPDPAAGRTVRAPGRDREVIQVTTAARGGMHAVIDAYQRDGLFERWPVHVLHAHVEGGLGRRLAAAVLALARFAGLLLCGRVALLHSHATVRGSFWRKALFAELARLFRVPVILHLHGWDERLARGARGALARRQLERADRVIVLTRALRRQVLDAAPGARVEVIANHVELPEPPRHREHADPHLLFLGLLGARKGVPELLQAFRFVHAALPAARLVLAGNGEERSIGQEIAALGLDGCVDVMGWVPEERKAAVFADADLLVLPSHREGLPLAVLEAMSFGLPVVATRVGGIPDVLTDGVEGFLVDEGDIEGLADRLTRLAADPELRSRLGAAGRRRVASTFSAAAVLPRLERLYEALAG